METFTMARVAVCPQCSHEILILDDGNRDAWAKCPECRAFFQLREAATREIRPAITIDEQSAETSSETAIAEETMLDAFEEKKAELTMSRASDATVSESHADFSDEDLAAQQPTEVVAKRDEPSVVTTATEHTESGQANASAVTISDLASLATWSGESPIEEMAPAANMSTADSQAASTPEDRLEESSDRIDKWFRKTKSEVDATTPTIDEDQHQAADSDDLEIEERAELLHSPATRDDVDQADDVLSVAESANIADPDSESDFSDEMETAGRNQVHVEVGPAGQRSIEPPQFFIPPGGLPRRKRSLLRTSVAMAASGVVGLSLGYFALLWIAGPRGDFLNIAQYLPGAVLPAEFQDYLAGIPVSGDRAEPPADSFVNRSEDNVLPDTADQASFTAPAQADEDTNIVDEDRYNVTNDANKTDSDAPLPFEDPTAAAMTPASGGEVKIASAPTFTADELALALQSAKEAQPKLVAGNLDDGREVQRAKGFAYSMLCDLAQKLTFVDATRAEYVDALASDAQRFFKLTLAEPHTRTEVARILPKWINSPHRQHGGVFFAGIAGRIAEKGPVVECQFNVGASETAIVLLSPERAAEFRASLKPLGIVGWIVDSPVEKISGYTGDATQAIWAGHILELE
jgi:hypothetical protein